MATCSLTSKDRLRFRRDPQTSPTADWAAGAVRCGRQGTPDSDASSPRHPVPEGHHSHPATASCDGARNERSHRRGFLAIIRGLDTNLLARFGSLRPQRHHRIDSRGPARRDVSRRERPPRRAPPACPEMSRVRGGHAEEEAREALAPEPRTRRRRTACRRRPAPASRRMMRACKSPADAPSAMRMPISCVRWLTE